MDLVSSTLDKYLKHRFNGKIVIPSSSGAQSMSKETSTETIEIQSISFQKLMPCCVALRHDETFIAAGYENSHIYLWHLSNSTSNSINNLGSRRTKHRLLAHSGPVYSIKFIKDKDLMLSCSEDTTIRLWCLITKCNLSIYRGHNYPIWSITIAPKDDYFASASMDATARLWRFDMMCPLRIFCGHDDDIECLEFHPNAKYVATGSADCTVRLWSIADGRSVRLLVGHQKPVVSLSFLPNGKLLASASTDGSIKLWSLETSCVAYELLGQQSQTQTSFSIGPEQSFASTFGCDNILRIWQVGPDKIVRIKEQDFKDEFAKIILAHFSRGNKLFVLGYTKPVSLHPE